MPHTKQPDVPEDVPTRMKLYFDLGFRDIIKPESNVYVCHQTLFKLTPDFDHVFRYDTS